ncbi:Na-translocating system protein MpsC family protein [Cytobacillus gottheilii]|uniref:Na-translocating system protein MpsC family protein n=1 Tax=Cytobacillus gottheilii TaxID=859144 RepID=UPI0009BAA56C|nr:Na-translocating system protein MpsC family protein [Cytobacillus gottheilii]
MLHLSSTLSKLLKRRFGKGPETCYVNGDEKKLYIFMRNFITPAEEVLLDNKQWEIAIHFRTAIIEAVIKEFSFEITQTLGHPYSNFYHDWNYEKNTGMILLGNGQANVEERLPLGTKSAIFSMIDKIGSRLHKRPEHLSILKYAPSICIIEAEGILAPLENFVYQTGNMNLLYRYSESIKKGYLEQKQTLEDFFNRIIEDIFIMWDYQNDKSYLVFTFRKEL